MDTGEERFQLRHSLVERLRGLSEDDRERRSVDEAYDAFVSVEAAAPRPGEHSDAAAERLVESYVAWGERRGMRVRRLDDQRPGAVRLAVSGLGAYRILAQEQGLHVFETPKSERRFARQTIQVIVAPWRHHDDERPLGEQADEALRGVERNRSIVRRYREEPSPLVRDSRGWRTGRLDTVLAGNFDVFS